MAVGFDALFQIGYAMDRLSGVIKDVVSPVTEISEQLGEVNKNFQSIGKNLFDSMDQLVPAIKGLPGSFAKNLEMSTSQLTEGFLKVNSSVAKLAVFERLTNQNAIKTIKQLKLLGTTMGLNNKQVGDLADSILKTSITYNAKSEDLVDSLSKYEDLLSDVNLIGGNSSKLAQAITTMNGTIRDEKGRAYLYDFLSKLLSGEQDDLNAVMYMGLKDIRDALVYNPTAELIQEAIRQSTKALDTFKVNSGNDSYDLTLLKQYGPMLSELPMIGQRLTNIQDTLSITKEENVTNLSKLTKSWGTLMETISAPLEMVVGSINTGIQAIVSFVGNVPVQIAGAIAVLAGISATLGFMFIVLESITTMMAAQGLMGVSTVNLLGKVVLGISVLGVIALTLGVFYQIYKSSQDEVIRQAEDQSKQLREQTRLLRSAEDRRNRNNITPGAWKEESGRAIAGAIDEYITGAKSNMKDDSGDIKNLLMNIYNKLNDINNNTNNTNNSIQDANLIKGVITG